MKPIALRASAKINARQRVFRLIANTGEPMFIAGFDIPIVIDLATVDTSGLPVPALYDHCAHGAEFLVGVVDAITKTTEKLIAVGRFTPTDDPEDKARLVLAKADAGHVWQCSVGGDPSSLEKIPAGQTGKANGRTYAGPVAIARGLVLREISFVVLGADRKTSAVVASHTRQTVADVVAAIRREALERMRAERDTVPATPYPALDWAERQRRSCNRQ